ncbi:hypothetical protein AcV5_005824 [Taiwanofungus camphoratus]|nr:hypothetical protein AcV5_005824 [Antrodia cinnamomea]
MTGPNLHLNDSMGCFFIGVFFSVAFYGTTCAQLIYYATEYPNDRWYLKCLVAFVWLLDTSSTILSVQIIWYYLVQGHANVITLTILPNTFVAEYAVAAIAVLLVQCYYMHNIWRLLGNRWYKAPLTAVMFILALISCACSFASVYLGAFNHRVPSIFDQTKIPASLQTVSATVTDVYITAALSWTLYGERTGFKHTETMIRKLTFYAINRGVFTAVLQVMQFITYTALPSTLVWSIFHFPGSSVYVNCLLAVLNARHHLRDTAKNGASRYLSTGLTVEDIPLEGLTAEDSLRSLSQPHRMARRAPAPHGVITLTTEVIRDEGSPEPSDEKKRREGSHRGRPPL